MSADPSKINAANCKSTCIDDPWGALKTSVDSFTCDFMVDGRNQPPLPQNEVLPFYETSQEKEESTH